MYTPRHCTKGAFHLTSLFPFVLAKTFFPISLLSVITCKIHTVTLWLHHPELKQYVVSWRKKRNDTTWSNIWQLATRLAAEQNIPVTKPRIAGCQIH